MTSGIDSNAHPRAAAGPSVASFRWLLLATCLATYALVVAGGIVRATGSGDACPDWPRCHGELIPPLSGHVWIEFSHRLLATVVGLLVAATVVVAYRRRNVAPLHFGGALLAAGLVIGQIVLGGATVMSDLHANVVMAHLAMAGTLFATLIVLLILTLDLPRDARSSERALAFRNVAIVSALAVLALMLTGSYVAGSGAGLAFRDWPLFDGKLMPDGGRLAMIHATHRFAAAAVGVLLAYLAYAAAHWRRGDRAIVGAAHLAFGLYIAQAFVGAANIWTLLQPPARGAHLALAMALWATLVVVATLATRRAIGLPRERAVAGTQPEAQGAPLPVRGQS